MLSLIYMSELAQPFDASALTLLEQQAAERNRGLNVTGMLVWNGNGFLQLLEGPTKSVEAIMASIARDTRHQNISIVRKVNRIVVNQRKPECPQWGMRSMTAPLRAAGSASRFAASLPTSMAMETRVVFTSFAASLRRTELV